MAVSWTWLLVLSSAQLSLRSSDLIIAFVVFMLVKMVNKTKAPEPEAEPEGPSAEDLLAEIRDSLQARAK